MGKRSDFERVERDFYPTPKSAVLPLLPHLPPNSTFYEPCAGDGRLVDHLEAEGHTCMGAWDIEPRSPDIMQIDTLTAKAIPFWADFYITNPPWKREILHPMILNLCQQLPTWLLFDADWIHTRQSKPYMPYLKKIVSIGRVKWIEDSKFTGKDNCCWYLFDFHNTSETIFVGR